MTDPVLSSERVFLETLRRDGVVTTSDSRLIPLAGGVSSEIYRVEDGPRTFVVKRALEKLRVVADWRADTSRNNYERLYLEYVGGILPGAVPRVLSVHDGYFTMEWLGEDWENWKARLLAGNCQVEDARAAGKTLGRIHRASSGNASLALRFDSAKNFRQLRLDPYLLATAEKHPDHRPLIEAEVARIASTRECLVHGDYSPKNILISGSRLVVLDCEVAWFGDPAFDLAFLLNHLLLKALYLAPDNNAIPTLFVAAREAYFHERRLPAPSEFDARTTGVLLLLLLARVDGKSPAEYLTVDKREKVRKFVLPRLGHPPASLQTVLDSWLNL